MSITVSESLHNFLHKRKTPANADLVDRWSTGMETQVNVIVADGEPVAGKRHTWSNGSDTWHSIRIPKNAGTEPVWEDYKIGYPFDLYAEGIGMTGWDWQALRSRHFGYDFDALTGHAKGIGIDDEQLEKVKQAACALPYVEVRRSTGGKGVHLYVYLDEAGVPTANHTEHAALARCILEMMSAECNFDFASAIDACGHVMWVWHRKMTAENHGLEIIKPAEKRLSAADLPANWRDRIDMVKRQRSKIRVNEIDEEGDPDPFEALASRRRIVPLDDSHKAQIEALMQSGYTTLWAAEHHLLQTHTCALRKLMEDKELKLVGVFKTKSEGRDPGTPNCFLFPLPNGAWRVYRFSPGIAEEDTWTQDGESWTTCNFNQHLDLETACTLFGGVEREQGGYAFSSSEAAVKAAHSMGQELKLPDIGERKVTLKPHPNGRLVVEIKRKEEDRDKPLEGWDNKKGKYVRIFRVRSDQPQIQPITSRELDSSDYELNYLVEDTLVEGQPCMVAGPKKAMKTSLLIALAIALATGLRFLGRLVVTRPCKVIILSGESGMATLQDTARRICRSMGVRLAEIKNLFWSDFLPKLDDRRHLDTLERMIEKLGCDVLIVDPAYLCIPGADASNLFVQGALLRNVSAICQRHGVGLILAHHTRKKGKTKSRSDYEPPELDDMAWAGFAEFARQWLLIGRREQYQPGTGEHKLWLNIGGSAGHSALWAVDIDEGVSGAPRHWEVELSRPDEARAEKKAGTLRQRLLDALREFPEGQTKTAILETANLKNNIAARNVFDALVTEGLLVPHKVRKNSVTYDGFRMATPSGSVA